jgi:hypothetical protein
LAKGRAVAYTIQWNPDGAVKYFTGLVTYDDIITAERVRDAIETSVVAGQTLHPTRVFRTYEEAVGCVVRQ